MPRIGIWLPRPTAACIEVAGGVASFTGIGSPLTTVKGVGAQISRRDLEEIESFFRDYGAATSTIEMAPWTSDWSQVLEERGYRVVGWEDVVATTAVGSRGRGPSRRRHPPTCME